MFHPAAAVVARFGDRFLVATTVGQGLFFSVLTSGEPFRCQYDRPIGRMRRTA